MSLHRVKLNQGLNEMPIYEYQCQACGHELEVIQKFSDEPLRECSKCQKPELQKLISASAFRLGGSGWYETDFKTAGKRNLAGGDEAASSVSGGETAAPAAAPSTDE